MPTIKQRPSVTTLFRIGLILWLSIITIIVISQRIALYDVADTTNSQDLKQHMQLVDRRIDELTTQLQTLQSDPFVTQSQLTDIQAELRTRIQAVSELSNTQTLSVDINKLNQHIQGLQADVNTLKKAHTEVKVASQPKPSPSKTLKKSSTAKNTKFPPFKILGVELRGGEPVLSVLPTATDNITGALLLTADQRIGAWQLISFNEHTAIFKAGSKTHRFNIPKP